MSERIASTAATGTGLGRMWLTTAVAVSIVAVAGANSTRAAAPWAQVERGRYLTVAAGKCSDCHGVRLQGSVLGFLKPGLPFAYTAPKIAGLPRGWSPEQTARFLETGITPSGGHAAAPMPRYRFSHSDAEAVTAYLQSLAGGR